MNSAKKETLKVSTRDLINMRADSFKEREITPVNDEWYNRLTRVTYTLSRPSREKPGYFNVVGNEEICEMNRFNSSP